MMVLATTPARLNRCGHVTAAVVASVTLLAACGAGSDTPVPANPNADSLPLAVMQHDAGAFASAPQWTVEEGPVVVYDGGTQPDFDLTHVGAPVRLSDGRLVAVHRIGGGRLMLFDARGQPARLLARSGSGPGELVAPTDPILVGRDTVIVSDLGTKRVSLFTADGLVRSMRRVPVREFDCLAPVGMLPDGRLAQVHGCVSLQDAGRLSTPVLLTELDQSAPVVFAMLPGWEFVAFETRYRGQRRNDNLPLRFSRMALVAVWDSSVVTATGEGGYVIDRRAPSGEVQLRIVVAEPRRVVTEAMRAARIESELAEFRGGTERMVDPEESRRQAREVPFADSLPPYQRLVTVAGGWLWVVDGQAPTDTSASATAFTPGGAIAARLTVPHAGTPIWFDESHLMMRVVDQDGVVRFVVYRMAPRAGS